MNESKTVDALVTKGALYAPSEAHYSMLIAAWGAFGNSSNYEQSQLIAA